MDLIAVHPVPKQCARSWWSNASNRSAAFSSLGAVTIPSTYTQNNAHSKNASSNKILSGHGTACASQIGGKSFGLAFKSNLWTIRITLGFSGGVLGSSVAVDACTIFHNAKKISQSGDPDPTILNCSYGITYALVTHLILHTLLDIVEIL